MNSFTYKKQINHDKKLKLIFITTLKDLLSKQVQYL